nr:hypothetical protein [Enterococcus ratti]
MKKIVGLGLILFFSIVLGACGNKEPKSDTPQKTTTDTSTMVNLESNSSSKKSTQN